MLRVLLALTLGAAWGGCGSKKQETPAPEAAAVAPDPRADPDPAPAGMAATGREESAGDDLEGEIPEPRCPIASGDGRDTPHLFDRLLDESSARLEALDFAAATACADVAADLEPSSIEAHHLRASGLAALGNFADAQVAYAMALALDPDDPETLAAAAHFFINILPPKTRESTLVGLEHARRGSARAEARRRKDKRLRARLALLEAQALNDLARADEALVEVNDAIRLQPELVEARYERGVSLFNLCRFEEAGAAFKAVLGLAPDDPYAHYHMGLIYEREARLADAAAHFKRAWSHPSGEFAPPPAITAQAFRAELDEAIAELPRDTRSLLEGVTVEVVDLPDRADLVAVEPPFAPTILGLYRGLPRGVDDPTGASPARAILLYRLNLARAVRTRDELDRQIRRTLLHEIGHVAGLDEDQLRRRGLD
jgi:predicted Zn-dependent protease with MMP-like domain/Flp pilus assembly protein TadD